MDEEPLKGESRWGRKQIGSCACMGGGGGKGGERVVGGGGVAQASRDCSCLPSSCIILPPPKTSLCASLFLPTPLGSDHPTSLLQHSSAPPTHSDAQIRMGLTEFYSEYPLFSI
eukprot:757927-Hanusia_phi.AAC.2